MLSNESFGGDVYETGCTVCLTGSFVAVVGDGRSAANLGEGCRFDWFREPLAAALNYSDGARGDHPPYDPAAAFKILIPATQHTVSDERGVSDLRLVDLATFSEV